MDNIVSYDTDQGLVELTIEDAKNYIVSGDSSRISDKELILFMQICKYQGLNPFLKEVYLIKYGNEPATTVVGKEVFVKRATKHPRYKGREAGIVVLKKNGVLERRKGTLVAPGEALIGGWCKVYIDGWVVPLEIEVSITEYEKRNKYGEPTKFWATMPATMIQKVALVQALREAFPEQLQGLYCAAEVQSDDSEFDTTPDAMRLQNAKQEEKCVNVNPPESVPAEQNVIEGSPPNAQPLVTREDLKDLLTLAKGDKNLCQDTIKAFGYAESILITKEDLPLIAEAIVRVIEAEQKINNVPEEKTA